MYYGQVNNENKDGLTIGPIKITAEQANIKFKFIFIYIKVLIIKKKIKKISVGIITNLVVMPPSILLVYLFRKSRRRVTRSKKLKIAIKKIKHSNYKTK